jgi:hypothetical protein
MNKPFQECSLSDLSHEVSLAASAAVSPSVNADSAELLLPIFFNDALTAAVLSRHPLVRGSSGMVCTSDPESKLAWCRMLRDLCDSAGVAASDAALLRVYLVCKECAKRGSVRLPPDSPAASANQLSHAVAALYLSPNAQPQDSSAPQPPLPSEAAPQPPLPSEAAPASHPPIPAPVILDEKSIPLYVANLMSADTAAVVDAMKKLRLQSTIRKNPPIQLLIDAGAVAEAVRIIREQQFASIENLRVRALRIF